MKRILLLTVFLALTGSLFAQNVPSGLPQRQDRDKISIDPSGKDITINRNSYTWKPFDDVVGFSIYGSRYRKAKANRNWGRFLTCVAAPASALLLAYSIDEKIPGTAVLGGVAFVGSLSGGIPIWVKGRRELDWMLDDYAEKYGPKPYAASVTAGPTRNGVGIAFNF